MPEDRIEKIGSSRVQHGPLSDRVYLMHLAPGEAATVLAAMERLAREKGYSKLFAKIPAKSLAPFRGLKYEIEARIPDFYPDGDAALFIARFPEASRRRSADAEHIRRVLKTAQQRRGDSTRHPLPADCQLRIMAKEHAESMAGLYRRVFKSYPFPIFDPAYLRSAMEDNFRYFGVVRADVLVALAATEADDGGVEMTDFATDSSSRRANLGGHLLRAMEADAHKRGLKTAFTIARASSYGINILFARAGYEFGGTLINNTNIAGRVESMNIWYKPL